MFKKALLVSVAAALTMSLSYAKEESKSELVTYKMLTDKLKSDMKKSGGYATVDEVKSALKAKDWIVADVRTMEEWAGASIKGSVRIGRAAPELALENFVLDIDNNFTKDKIIIVCNSAARASIEAQAIKQMGFKEVKIFDIYSWIDNCNPVSTNYSVKKDSGGSGLSFGSYYAEHCINKDGSLKK